MLSAHAHNIEYYGLVKVVNNASATLGLAGSDPQTGMQSQNVRYLRGGEIGGAGGASAPPLGKQGGLSPPILSQAHTTKVQQHIVLS